MKFAFYIIWVWLSLAVLVSCNKYAEDDVFLQIKRPEKRLLDGSPWTFRRLYENDIDISSIYKNDSAYVKSISFIGGQDLQYPNSPTLSFVCPTCQSGGYGSYKIYDKNRYLKFGAHFGYGPVTYFQFIYNETEWRIRAIDVEDFIIECNYNNNKYRIEFYK